MNPEEFHKYYPRLLGWIDTTLSMSALPPKADICSAHCIAKLELPSSMSALGQKQTFARHQSMSALPPRADIRRRSALYAGRQHLRLKIGFGELIVRNSATVYGRTIHQTCSAALGQCRGGFADRMDSKTTWAPAHLSIEPAR